MFNNICCWLRLSCCTGLSMTGLSKWSHDWPVKLWGLIEPTSSSAQCLCSGLKDHELLLNQRFSTWGTQAVCRTQKVHILVFYGLKIKQKALIQLKFFRPGGTIWVKFIFGDTCKAYNMIWGYASTKRLRTAVLNSVYQIDWSIINCFLIDQFCDLGSIIT